ncbi:MAG TPA: right-handed parallel beta-helix repeat-containing protein [Planctomycetota bacterium]|jgi:predicted outer membrane repeat protein|nr:right-handed parallel beta-helix repeat-containing protein [Planctomycetota bacterium]OQC19217.1 MAG: hypothetical protein BWX69_02916 [Planctomycetes bacterium ADurb.Bin069]HNS00328.1 right-handed parallel beta-helix repeat-containing protein [Planctomycetota bacterium]HNU27334.1 right-handed parallel beta-helix repeat-containing protein [Planctomycetota bacterium]HOE31125.1 right-handed parallel beta-helix repeat-containing protein [Planctomycetota bacterium]
MLRGTALLPVVLSVSLCMGATIEVPADYAAIQAAIDAAVAGDTVLVGPGEYAPPEPITLRGKAIEVKSREGPLLTTIRQTVVFENNETQDAVFRGFTTSGFQLRSASPRVADCHVVGMTQGVSCETNSNGLFEDCVFAENVIDVWGTPPFDPWVSGGGAYCADSAPTFLRCTFRGNTANIEYYGVRVGGGGLFCWNSSPRLVDCTLRENSAKGRGGAVYCVGDAAPTFVNCTISGNVASEEGGAIYSETAAAPVLVNCILWDNIGGPFGGRDPVVSYSCVEGPDVWPGVGNINGNPGFCGWTTDDVIHVDMITQGPGSGQQSDPFPTVAAALRGFRLSLYAGSPCIGAGEDGADMGAPHGVCEDAGVMEREIVVEGGAYGEGVLNLVNHVSVTGRGPDSTVIRGTLLGLRTGCSVAGITVTEGKMGGMIIGHGQGPEVSDCRIADNTTHPGSPLGGGGILCNGASAVFRRCEVLRNSTLDFSRGDGVACHYSTLSFIDCVFALNRPLPDHETNGGGLYCRDSSVTLSGCTIWGNFEGGMYSYNSSATLINCAIFGNSGGEVAAVRSSDSLSLVNCTIAENWWGGGVSHWGSSPATLTNCIVWGNARGGLEGPCAASYSCLQDGETVPGVGNIYVDPRFRGDLDFRLQPDSPCIDAGTTQGAPADDIEGNPRLCGAGIDIGAYEYCPVRQLALTSAGLAECAPAHLFVLLTNEQPVQAFSLGVAHDPSVATLDAIDFTDCPEIQALNGGRGPDFFGVDLAPGTGHCSPEITAGGTVYCIASQTQPSTVTIPAGSDHAIVRLTYEAVPGRPVGTETSPAIVACLGGELPRAVVITIDGLSYTPKLEGGTLTIAPAACRFIRGDANGDGRVDLSDVVALLMYMFESGRGPLRCEDAGDANDDGALDIADPTRILGRLFAAAPPFSPPYPGCGTDPTPDALRCSASLCE